MLLERYKQRLLSGSPDPEWSLVALNRECVELKHYESTNLETRRLGLLHVVPPLSNREDRSPRQRQTFPVLGRKLAGKPNQSIIIVKQEPRGVFDASRFLFKSAGLAGAA